MAAADDHPIPEESKRSAEVTAKSKPEGSATQEKEADGAKPRHHRKHGKSKDAHKHGDGKSKKASKHADGKPKEARKHGEGKSRKRSHEKDRRTHKGKRRSSESDEAEKVENLEEEEEEEEGPVDAVIEADDVHAEEFMVPFKEGVKKDVVVYPSSDDSVGASASELSRGGFLGLDTVMALDAEDVPAKNSKKKKSSTATTTAVASEEQPKHKHRTDTPPAKKRKRENKDSAATKQPAAPKGVAEIVEKKAAARENATPAEPPARTKREAPATPDTTTPQAQPSASKKPKTAEKAVEYNDDQPITLQTFRHIAEVAAWNESLRHAAREAQRATGKAAAADHTNPIGAWKRDHPEFDTVFRDGRQGYESMRAALRTTIDLYTIPGVVDAQAAESSAGSGNGSSASTKTKRGRGAKTISAPRGTLAQMLTSASEAEKVEVWRATYDAPRTAKPLAAVSCDGVSRIPPPELVAVTTYHLEKSVSVALTVLTTLVEARLMCAVHVVRRPDRLVTTAPFLTSWISQSWRKIADRSITPRDMMLENSGAFDDLFDQWQRAYQFLRSNALRRK